MNYLKASYHKDKKIILGLLIWFIVASIVLWNANENFFVLAPIMIIIVLSIPFIILFTLISWIRHKHSVIPFFCMFLFAFLWFCIPDQEIKTRNYFSQHKEELISISEKMKQDLILGNKDKTYMLSDDQYIYLDMDMKANDFYFKISVNEVLLADATQWIVYTSNDTIEKVGKALSLDVKDYMKLEDHFYYVKGTELDNSITNSKTPSIDK